MVCADGIVFGGYCAAGDGKIEGSEASDKIFADRSRRIFGRCSIFRWKLKFVEFITSLCYNEVGSKSGFNEVFYEYKKRERK